MAKNGDYEPATPLIMSVNDKKERTKLVLVPHSEVFSNRFLEDLEKIWELRYYIPDPNKLEYANCACALSSRYKGKNLQGW